MGARTILSLLCVLFALAPLVQAQDDASRKAARERWESLDPEAREKMRERYERLKRMNPQQRARVERQSKRLNEMRRRLWKSLDGKTRARLDKFSNAKRLELLDEMLADEVEGTAQRIIERLTPTERQRLEQATPVDRMHFLRERKKRQDVESDRLLRRLATELGVRPNDVAGMRELLPQERRQKIREMMRARIVQSVDKRPLPKGVSPEGWQRIQALGMDEFFAAVTRLRRSHLDFGSPPGASGAVVAGSPRARLRHALQAHPEDRVELANLSREERRVEMQQRRKARALEVLREDRRVPEQRLRELEDLPFPRFMRAARGLAMPGQRKPGRGRPGADGPAGERRGQRNDD
ncbi:MAG: hypothetical protein GY711_07375 [bacterium]|nr:hypothetical protein [bacterium]